MKAEAWRSSWFTNPDLSFTLEFVPFPFCLAVPRNRIRPALKMDDGLLEPWTDRHWSDQEMSTPS